MTKAEMETLTRRLIKESETAVGALFPSDNVLLDLLLDFSLTLVCLDLSAFLPSEFLTSENVSLVANTASYTLTGTPIQYWAVLRNITGEKPRTITYIDPGKVAYVTYVGEKTEFPSYWYYTGEKSITFVPTPSVTKANYAKVWYISAEATTLGTNGPTYIPTPLHRLVPLKAVEIICAMTETDPKAYKTIYNMFISQAIRLYGFRVQNAPKFLNPDPKELQFIDERDPGLYDIFGMFETRGEY